MILEIDGDDEGMDVMLLVIMFVCDVGVFEWCRWSGCVFGVLFA